MSVPAQAAGSYKFCTRWAYSYIDQGKGEDYLLHTLGNGSYGAREAAYAYTEIVRDGALIWAGVMDSAGCSPVLSGAGGYYELWTTTDLEVPNGGPRVSITPTDSQEWRWFYADYGEMPTVTIPYKFWVNFGPGDNVLQAAAAAETLLTQSDRGGLMDGHRYWIYADDPNVALSHYGGAVYLGQNPQFTVMRGVNVSDASLKSVILHELGHGVQEHLFGLQSKDYNSGDEPNVALCKCDHVWDPSDRQHCIQSREEPNAAQIEGFGHFVAATAQNNGSQNDAFFPYYKNVLWTDGLIYYPPFAFSATTWRWVETKCTVAAQRASELDWMSFLYWTHRGSANAFSFLEIANIYKGACGGSCATPFGGPPRYVYWTQLRSVVDTVWGQTSAKANLWRNNGTAYGVTL